ncbi:hypothetical protein NXY56_004205 [Leishmania guyanensis]
MKRRVSATRLPGAFATPAGASPLPATELCVYECSSGAAAVVESPQWREWRKNSGCSDDSKLYNELSQLEVTMQKKSGTLQAILGDVLPKSPSVIGPGALQTSPPTGELLLQKEEFLGQLVQRVRASCASVPREHSASTSDSEQDTGLRTESHRVSSPLPRRPSPSGVKFAESTRVRSSDAGQRSMGRSRSRSPSPISASSMVKRLTQPAATEAVQAQTASLVGRGVQAPGSPMYQRSSPTSPDPRPPSTDLYATGGALRSSLQYSRCSGVSRGRRSLSAERPDNSDARVPLASPIQEADEKELDSFWSRATAAWTGVPGVGRQRSLSGIRSESVHHQSTHPQWNPHPIQAARPAWNQRQPQKKQRPVVSVPGSQPPSSGRRCASRSSETPINAQGLRGARSEEKDARGASHRSAERSLRRTASISLHLKQEQPTAPRHTTGQSPRAAVTSPLSPPSARALFQSHDAHSVAQTTSPLEQERETSLQSRCDVALARATQAERQCSILSHALEQLLVDHAAEKTAWAVRHAALEQRVTSIAEWISGIDAEANLNAASQEATGTPAPETAISDTTTSQVSTEQSEAGDTACPTVTAVAKSTTWEEDVDIADITNNSGSHSADGSPLPCAPGATPTPARCNSANTDGGNASACQVRLPPSPPLILHMHAAAATQ